LVFISVKFTKLSIGLFWFVILLAQQTFFRMENLMKKTLVLISLSLLTANAFARTLSNTDARTLVTALRDAGVERNSGIEMSHYVITDLNCKKNLCNYVNQGAVVELKGDAANKFISTLSEVELTELDKNAREAGMDIRIESIDCHSGRMGHSSFADCKVK
jgi:hypothetical protein